jgi:hypothetical protein
LFISKTILGCHFNFLQVLRRHKDIKGLKVQNGKNEKIELFVKNFMALPYVPLDFLNNAFDSILKIKSSRRR